MKIIETEKYAESIYYKKILGKEPWQMKRDEYIKNELHGIGAQRRGNRIILKYMHRRYVKIALSEGKPVPPEVLVDYPEYAKPPVLAGIIPIPQEIFIRPITQKEKANPQRAMMDIPNKEGYETIYRPYGEQGKGFYYRLLVSQ